MGKASGLRLIVRCALAVALLAAMASSAGAVGAFAVGQCGAYGQAVDFPTPDAARKQALSHCGAQCRVVGTMKKQCAALAIDLRQPCGPHGYAVNRLLGAAQNAALQQCYQFGGKDCVVRAFACDGRQ